MRSGGISDGSAATRFTTDCCLKVAKYDGKHLNMHRGRLTGLDTGGGWSWGRELGLVNALGPATWSSSAGLLTATSARNC